MKSQELPTREPYSPRAVLEDIEQTFVFNNAPTPDQVKQCEHIEGWAKVLSLEIATQVPEGKEKTMAINNVLAAVVWCRHAIFRQPTIEFGVTGQKLQEDKLV
jgi:hypothetical protein